MSMNKNNNMISVNSLYILLFMYYKQYDLLTINELDFNFIILLFNNVNENNCCIYNLINFTIFYSIKYKHTYILEILVKHISSDNTNNDNNIIALTNTNNPTCYLENVTLDNKTFIIINKPPYIDIIKQILTLDNLYIQKYFNFEYAYKIRK